MEKSDCCICENKAADQLRVNLKADQCLCFCYKDNVKVNNYSIFAKDDLMITMLDTKLW